MSDILHNNILLCAFATVVKICYLYLFFDFRPFLQIVILYKGYTIFIDTETDVTLSQLNVWSVEQHVTSDRRCDAGVNGDMIGWKELEDADIDGAFIQTPSVCDGMYRRINKQ